jgi:hypothetical protein
MRERAQRLRHSRISFIPNALFQVADAEERIGPPEQSSSDAAVAETWPADLPGHVARFCEAKLLTAEEEKRLFCRMNFLKFKAHAMRRELDFHQPDGRTVERIEGYLAEATRIRDRIVTANMSLVI